MTSFGYDHYFPGWLSVPAPSGRAATATRYGVFDAGSMSVADPAYIVPQRARLAAAAG